MAHKDTCTTLAKVAPDEPIFVLRAKDVCAPDAVRHWIDLASAAGSPPEKLEEARLCALAMGAWQIANGWKVPD